MNSSATDRKILLANFLNRYRLRLLAVVAVVGAVLSYAVPTFALYQLIPTERHDDARLIAYVAFLIPGIVIASILLTHAYVVSVVERYVTRPVVRLTKRLEQLCRDGEGPSLRTFTRVIEILNLTGAFRRLYGLLALRVAQIRHLVGGMRHNLRAHLSHISNAAQFAKSGKCSAAEAAEVALNEVKAITHILDVNAEIAKNFSHILGDPPTEIRVADVVQKCLDGLELLAEEKGVELDTEYPPDDLVVVAHLGKIDDIIHNLVDNAIKYTPEGGKVRLAVRSRPDAKTSAPSQLLEIEVSDTGIGIPEADKPHVFEYAFRSASAATLPGDGYGLNHVASIMSLYGGKSEIRDNTPQGTVITIRLALSGSPVRSDPSGQPLGFHSRSRLPRLYPKSNSGWLYALLTTVPMAGGFGAILFYEWFGNNDELADATAVAAIFALVYDAFVIGWKYLRLRALGKRKFAASRLRIVRRVIYLNASLIATYFLWRFYYLPGAIVGVVGSVIAYVLFRAIFWAMRFIYRRLKRS